MNPQREVLRILVTIANDDLRDAQLGPGSYSRDHIAAQLGVCRESSERDEAVGLTVAHRLGEIERPVIAASGEPFETALDQPLQSISEMVAAEKLAAIYLPRARSSISPWLLRSDSRGSGENSLEEGSPDLPSISS